MCLLLLCQTSYLQVYHPTQLSDSQGGTRNTSWKAPKSWSNHPFFHGTFSHRGQSPSWYLPVCQVLGSVTTGFLLRRVSWLSSWKAMYGSLHHCHIPAWHPQPSCSAEWCCHLRSCGLGSRRCGRERSPGRWTGSPGAGAVFSAVSASCLSVSPLRVKSVCCEHVANCLQKHTNTYTHVRAHAHTRVHTHVCILKQTHTYAHMHTQ